MSSKGIENNSHQFTLPWTSADSYSQKRIRVELTRNNFAVNLDKRSKSRCVQLINKIGSLMEPVFKKLGQLLKDWKKEEWKQGQKSLPRVGIDYVGFQDPEIISKIEKIVLGLPQDNLDKINKVLFEKISELATPKRPPRPSRTFDQRAVAVITPQVVKAQTPVEIPSSTVVIEEASTTEGAVESDTEEPSTESESGDVAESADADAPINDKPVAPNGAESQILMNTVDVSVEASKTRALKPSKETSWRGNLFRAAIILAALGRAIYDKTDYNVLPFAWNLYEGGDQGGSDPFVVRNDTASSLSARKSELSASPFKPLRPPAPLKRRLYLTKRDLKLLLFQADTARQRSKTMTAWQRMAARQRSI